MKAKYETPAPDFPGETDDRHAARPLTLTQNVILTLKVLLCAGLVIAVLWGLSAWTAVD